MTVKYTQCKRPSQRVITQSLKDIQDTNAGIPV